MGWDWRLNCTFLVLILITSKIHQYLIKRFSRYCFEIWNVHSKLDYAPYIKSTSHQKDVNKHGRVVEVNCKIHKGKKYPIFPCLSFTFNIKSSKVLRKLLHTLHLLLVLCLHMHVICLVYSNFELKNLEFYFREPIFHLA